MLEYVEYSIPRIWITIKIIKTPLASGIRGSGIGSTHCSYAIHRYRTTLEIEYVKMESIHILKYQPHPLQPTYDTTM